MGHDWPTWQLTGARPILSVPNVRFWDSLFEWILGTRGDHRRAGTPDHSRQPDGAETGVRGGAGVGVLDGNPSSSSEAAEPWKERWWTPDENAPLDFAQIAPPALSTEAAGLDQILTGYRERDDLRLPALPKAAERVLQLLAGDSRDARRIADEIANDQVVSLAVLRQANCVFYRGRERVTDLRVAVSRLGELVLRSLMLQHSLQAATQPRHGDRRLAAIVWNGSLASAGIMRGLAGLVRTDAQTTYPAGMLRVDAEEAYLAGLLHDVGNVLVLREAQEQQAVLRYHIDPDEFAWLCREHHERLGKLIADAWNLPSKLKALIADHHQPVADGTSGDLAMLALTDMLKSMLGYAPRGSFNLPQSVAARTLGLADQPEFAVFLDRLPDELKQVQTSF
jgi:HD-like signal output (HDOD) protein